MSAPSEEEIKAVVLEIINYPLDEVTHEYGLYGAIQRHVGWHNANGMAHRVIQALERIRSI